jgi:membrane-associated phospholipid phosphatase
MLEPRSRDGSESHRQLHELEPNPASPGARDLSFSTSALPPFGSINLTDGLFLAWYLALTVALFTRPHPFASYAGYFVLHLIIIALVVSLTACSPFGRWWRFAHDWYPTLVFVAAFEETARLSLIFIPHWQDALILRAEAVLFNVPPSLWLNRIHEFWIVELLEFGYFTFYWIMFVVGGVLYAGIWNANSAAEAVDSRQPFRIWMDATVLGYVVCYIVFLAFPTEGPAHTLPRHLSTGFTGPFHWLVQLIQHHAGVHGNAFPSGHIMASVVALLAAAKWKPRLARWLALPVFLMCVGAVYDGYHYAADIVAGALLGAAVFWLLCRFSLCRFAVFPPWRKLNCP